jgi:hypothetical protein
MSEMTDKPTKATRLKHRRKAAIASLPSFSELLRGSFFERSIRCGKPSCRCASGPGHPRAYLGTTFPGGRTEQIVVPPHLVPLVRRWVANYQRWWRAIERVSEINRRLLRERLLTSSTSPAAGSRRSKPSR